MVAKISTAKVRWHLQGLSRDVGCPSGAAARWWAVNYAIKKRINSPACAIDHPEDLKCEVALTGFTWVTGFTRVLEAALLQQGCGYGYA